MSAEVSLFNFSVWFYVAAGCFLGAAFGVGMLIVAFMSAILTG